LLISKTATTKWNQATRKYYEDKGYVFTKYYEEFEVRISDLSDGSQVPVEVECDKCGEIYNVIWKNYKSHVHEDDKYYCKKCATGLFGSERTRKTRLKNGKSFYQWCYDNLTEEEADIITTRWDNSLNIDKDGNELTSKDVSYGSQGYSREGYWFKCPDNPSHTSELKDISGFTNVNGGTTLCCLQCISISVTHPNLVKYLVNKDDALRYSYGSSKIKIMMKCPYCGFEKKREVSQLVKYGLACPKCGDGISYPEKFLFNVLEQLLGRYFETQTIFPWSYGKRYDFYIPCINCIIETHGLQHYHELKMYNTSFSEGQDNDNMKEMLGYFNTDQYIILDCRKSELEWIKNSIMTSELINIFDLSNINWLKCHEYACSSLVKEVCDLWNSEIKNALEISKILNITKYTAIKYLKQGTKLGKCDYNSKVESNRNYHVIKVICLSTGEVFNSIREASEKSNINRHCISDCCNNKQRSAGKNLETGEVYLWMHYDKYISLNYNNELEKELIV